MDDYGVGPPVGYRVLVTTRSFGAGTVDVVRLLSAAGIGVVRASGRHDPDELAEILPTVQGWVTGRAPVTAELLDLAGDLRVLTRFGTDVDTIDLAAAIDREIVVTNTPGNDAESVADHAVGLLLAALRGAVDGDRRVRAGRWTSTRGRELRAITVGIVGYGDTGRGLARRLTAFGATVLVHRAFVRPAGPDASGAGEHDDDLALVVPHEQLVSECDVVVLLADGGVPIVDARWIKDCREGQILVTAGPGVLVDEDDVAAGLRSGRLAAYAADTLADRYPADGPSPLLDADLVASVVVTPHLGAETVEAIDRKGVAATEDLIAVLSGRAARNVIEPYEVPVARFDRLARFTR